MPGEILSMTGISKVFGGVIALDKAEVVAHVICVFCTFILLFGNCVAILSANAS